MGFTSLDSLWEDAAVRLLGAGAKVRSRAGDTVETLGYRARLDDVTQNWLFNHRRKLSAQYAAGELTWYLAGSNEGDHICAYAPSYKRFLNDDIAFGAYGPRIVRALSALCEQLLKANSRQAVLPIFEYRDLSAASSGDINDIPCTLTWQLIARDGRLNMIATMRSNDLWLGTPYDVWAFSTIQRVLAGGFGIEAGWYQHQVGSMHAYSSCYDRVEEALETRTRCEPLDINFNFDDIGDMFTKLDRLVVNERVIRCHGGMPRSFGDRHAFTYLSHLCAVQHGYDDRAVLETVLDPRILAYCPKLRT